MSRGNSRHQLPVLTGDGSDGFPSEADFMVQMDEYLAGLNPKKRAKALMTREMYATILAILLDPHSTAQATAQFRFWAKRMFRLVVTPTANLVAHENRPVAVKDQIYAILVGTHGDVNHGGRDKTSAQVRRFYSWLPKELVSRFVKMCPTCIAKRRQQQPYLSDACLPANLALPSRRVQLNIARADASDPEDSPEQYEHAEEAAIAGPSLPQPRRAGSIENVYDGYTGIGYYEPLTEQQQQIQLFEQYSLDPLGDAMFDPTYPLYFDDSTSFELPQPPQDITYVLPPAVPDELEQTYEQPAPTELFRPEYVDGGEDAPQAVSYQASWQPWELEQDGQLVSEPQETVQMGGVVEYEEQPFVVEPQAEVANDWADGYFQQQPAPKVALPSSWHYDEVPTVVVPPPCPPSSSRRGKPPPLELGRSSNLHPSHSIPPAAPKRSVTLGDNLLLSPSYRHTSTAGSSSSSGPLSAPLHRSASQPYPPYGTYRDQYEGQISPGLPSACSTASTAFSSGSSLPLTPGTSASSMGSAGLCAPNFLLNWAPQAPVEEQQQQQSSGQWDQERLDEAIRLLLDSTSMGGGASGSGASSAGELLPDSTVEAVLEGAASYYTAEPEQLFHATAGALGLEVGGSSSLFLPPSAPVIAQPNLNLYYGELQQPYQPPQQQQQHPRPTQSRRTSSYRAAGRSRDPSVNAALEYSSLAAALETPTKGMRRVSSATATGGGHVLTRTPTREALRFNPY
ncbi:hypothetical protein JCM8547_006625 [Rhodosporidiobolus lusitaniae]